METRLGRIERTVYVASGGIAIIIFLVGWVFRPIIVAMAEKIVGG